MNIDKGLRFNDGKTRHDLVPVFAQEQYARVLTKGSEKYAERNWELGMKWSKVIASMKRHIQAFESGEDYDKETGLLHTAHIMCNAGFLTEYYKIYPQGDDRPHKYLKTPKIGLDIDEVLADWVGHWTKYHGQEVPEAWNFDRNIGEKFDKLKDDKEFWLSIPVKQILPIFILNHIVISHHVLFRNSGQRNGWTKTDFRQCQFTQLDWVKVKLMLPKNQALIFLWMTDTRTLWN